MIKFSEFTLDNGLRVIVHKDPTTPIVAFNLVYNVGARDETEDKTGFAHLFEHLMFGGSKHIPSFDGPLQLVGGENNAFTSNDLTNYYITLPKDSLETAFWLESDRMLSLAFSEKSLEVQRQVVIEEFNQRYLNQPYGDAFLKLRPLAYKQHPYKWATIGKEISHIEQATMEQVKDFFYTHYRPNNAVLSIAGDVDLEEVKRLSKKWFGDIEPGIANQNTYPTEPEQQEERRLVLDQAVPLEAIYMAFHMVDRLHPDYQAHDLLSDVLSRGNASRFYQSLVKEKQIFAEITSYITGDRDAGLFMISGKLNPGISLKKAEHAIWEELEALKVMGIKAEELSKVKNKLLTSLEYANNSALNRAMGLAIAGLMGDPNYINTEVNEYEAVLETDLQRVAKTLFQHPNASIVLYKKLDNES